MELGGAGDDGLSIRVRKNVLLLPIIGDRGHKFGFRVGGYDVCGRNLPEFRIERSWGSSEEPAFEEPIGEMEEEAVYGGVMFPHFGHFLLETLARLWWLRRAPTWPIVWHTPQKKLLTWQKEIFALFGVDTERFHYVEQPTRFNFIVTAAPGFRIGLDFHRIHAQAMACFQFEEPQEGKRVWLSRAGLPENAGRVVDEKTIESVLVERGWFIFCPEKVDVRTQCLTLKDAEIIAGFEGSAFHILTLANACKAKVRIIGRGNNINKNYELIAKGKDLNQEVLASAVSVLSGIGSRATTKLVTPIDAVLHFVTFGT